MRTALALALVALGMACPDRAAAQNPSRPALPGASDSAAVVSAVDAYHRALASADTASVIDWVQGSLLTQYRRQLDEATYDQFLAQYRRELLAELGDPAGDKPYTHLFNRILFRARR